MPALRTEITEIVTGLGMFGFPDLRHALAVRPRALRNVDEGVYELLERALRNGGHDALFRRAWNNGVRFAGSPEGLRGRPPWLIEWKGGHRPPGYEQIPADLRVDHVYLVSCKYGSKILMNAAPAALFEDSSQPGDDWFGRVAPEEYQQFYSECRRLVGGRLPPSVKGLDRADRRRLKQELPRRLEGSAKAAYLALTDAVSSGSSLAWAGFLATPRRQEEVLWRLLRMQSAPYFVLGESREGHPLAYRVSTPWDLRASHRFLSFRHRPEPDRGQAVVSWEARLAEARSGAVHRVKGHVEIRWSHGKFAQVPEAKVYLDTPHHLVPGYVPLDIPDPMALFAE